MSEDYLTKAMFEALEILDDIGRPVSLRELAKKMGIELQTGSWISQRIRRLKIEGYVDASGSSATPTYALNGKGRDVLERGFIKKVEKRKPSVLLKGKCSLCEDSFPEVYYFKGRYVCASCLNDDYKPSYNPQQESMLATVMASTSYRER